MYFDSEDLLELEEYLKNNNIQREKVCLVGSATLSLLGIRNHDDIDIIIHSSIKSTLLPHRFIDPVNSPWSRLYTDDQIIENSVYHITYNGYKFVIPELIYHRKIWHNRLKDINDIYDLNDYSKVNENWDWNLLNNKLPKKSRLHRFIFRIKRKKSHLENIFRDYLINDYSLHPDCFQMIPTNFLLSKQIADHEFNRFDLIVRYLAIDSFFGESLNFELYQKMQDKRKGSLFKDPWKRFRYLINSFNNYGYDHNYPIILNNDLHIVDGAHRLACALYFNIPFVPVRINKRLSYCRYGLNWFKENDFSFNEVVLLKDHKDVLFLERNLYFKVILWPPASDYFNDIEKDISDQFQILESTNYNNIKDFDEFTRALYKIDDIKDWKVSMKIKGFANYQKDIRILNILIAEPDFRRKENGSYISKRVEKLKSEIREKYSVKITNYFHDIIIHVGDNYNHTERYSSLNIHT